MEIDMITETQIKIWDYYFQSGEYSYLTDGVNHFPCDSNACRINDCRTFELCGDVVNDPTARLNDEEFEEYFELRPEYKIIK